MIKGHLIPPSRYNHDGNHREDQCQSQNLTQAKELLLLVTCEVPSPQSSHLLNLQAESRTNSSFFSSRSSAWKGVNGSGTAGSSVTGSICYLLALIGNIVRYRSTRIRKWSPEVQPRELTYFGSLGARKKRRGGLARERK